MISEKELLALKQLESIKEELGNLLSKVSPELANVFKILSKTVEINESIAEEIKSKHPEIFNYLVAIGMFLGGLEYINEIRKHKK